MCLARSILPMCDRSISRPDGPAFLCESPGPFFSSRTLARKTDPVSASYVLSRLVGRVESIALHCQMRRSGPRYNHV